MPHLSLRTKLGYGVADIGASLSYNAVNFFFLFYLVEIIGLRPGLAGAALLSGRLIDAVTDPLMGTLSDRTRSRYGRRKPYIWAGLVPFGLSFALLWMVPSASQGIMFVLAALALALHAVIYTVVQVPYMALTPELAPEYGARTSLSSYRIGFGTLASLLAAAAPPLLVASLNSVAELPEEAHFGWSVMGVIFGAVMSVSYLLMALSVKEPERSGDETAQPPLRSVLKVRGYLALIALFASVTVGLGIVSSMLPFYLGSLQLEPSQQTLILGLLFVVAILALPLWNWLAAQRGKATALALGLAILISGLLLIVLVVPSTGLSLSLISAVALAGVGTGAALLFPWAMLPDVVEFDLLAHGARREGLLYAVFTFAQKSAFALGAALNALVLELANYTPDATPDIGTQSAQSAITWMVGPVAAAAFFVALLLAWRYPIRKADHDAARAALSREV